MAAYSDYLVDLMQRQVIFLDILRKRGNGFVEMERKGLPRSWLSSTTSSSTAA